MMKDGQMEISRGIQLNLGTFNIPTLVLVGGLIWTSAGKQERTDARLDAIEIAIQSMRTSVLVVPNLDYRMTVAEQSLVSLNQRQDRFGDSISGVRDSMATLSTKFEVLTQRLELVVPLRKSEVETQKPAGRSE